MPVSDESHRFSSNWKELSRFVLSVFLWSVAVNYPWEMAQMPLYVAMDFSDPMSWLICFQASLGDGFIVLFIWGTGYLIFRDLHWFRRKSMITLAFLLISGAIIAVGFEIHAIQTGRWAYSGLMPIVPGIEVGLSPLVQLIILPGLAMILARRFGNRKQGTGEILENIAEELQH